MTDEEIATKIADSFKEQTYFDPQCNQLAGNVAYAAAMVALKEDEERIRVFLEKKYDTALNAWDDWAAYDPKTAESWRVKTQYIREIIKELYGGE